jgi:hypothetical protein
MNVNSSVVPFQPFLNMLIAGETKSGKTVLIEKLIKYRDVMFQPEIDDVIVFYMRYQQLYSRWEWNYPNVKCYQGVREDVIENLDTTRKTLLVLDDMMTETAKDPYILSLYTAGRHLGLGAIITTWHNLFVQGRNTKTVCILLNTYLVLSMYQPQFRYTATLTPTA